MLQHSLEACWSGLLSQYDELGIDLVSLSGQQVVTPLFHRTQGGMKTPTRTLTLVRTAYSLPTKGLFEETSLRSHCQHGEFKASNYVLQRSYFLF